MWNTNDKIGDEEVESNSYRNSSSVSSTQQTFIGPSVTIKGEINSSDDILVEGKIEGSINLEKNKLVVGKSGVIDASLTAKEVKIEGKVDGDITSSDLVMIDQSGRATGTIKAKRVVLKDGCRFKGTIDMDMDSSTTSTTSK
ncbi:MAG: polymer-forming cytoskeletal protein [Thiotrichales bacterium]|jgi:cytoskeletal protein CcmA (bactofilin family)|nr:polymer-forming cytoskeletal protein [Thiotrichales bacterium]MBT3613588.1 polymer-forming cytoskeletal protein [Thiotrichales bacterium]MBT3753320.1 polymer-forming cytoskeletal protein [Thiotrichales bacterium]MBT3837237.1 polymer-forming cytoskeletal protein [Thiotrichales bacterium]MBT4152153.1 polymer-forming cytoskeletal protein [Thiotrichales bacterium]